jgi:hypothetical protein
MPDVVEHLLFRNGNGALCLAFPPTDSTMEILWKEFYLHPTTIHVWGNKPVKRRFYDLLKKMLNLQSRKGLFNCLPTESDGNRSLTIDLCNAMSKLTHAAEQSGFDADATKLGPIYLSLTNLIMKPVSSFGWVIFKWPHPKGKLQ